MNDLTLFEELALVGLADGKAESGRTPSELLNPDLRRALAGAKPGLVPALRRLAELGLVEELPRAPRQRAARWRIHARGRKALHEILGGLSTQGRTWKQKASRIVAAQRVLHLTPHAAAALVERDALPAYFLAERLGEAFQPSTTLDNLARRVAAGALGLTNDQPETLWRAVLQRAAATQETPVGEAEALRQNNRDVPESHPSPSHEARLLSFPEEIHRAARTTEDGWFGSHKIFIHRAWEAWKAATGDSADLPAFKARLLESLRAGEIALTRADFTVGLNPTDLQTAETRYGNEVFHFITSQRDEQP